MKASKNKVVPTERGKVTAKRCREEKKLFREKHGDDANIPWYYHMFSWYNDEVVERAIKAKKDRDAQKKAELA